MCKSRLFRCCLVALLIYAPSALAKTPDGETPATEAVCDVLKAPGVTPGLYGLCVAYCEAHDADEVPAASRGRSADRILDNYNKKRKDGDRYMPCLPEPVVASEPEPVPPPPPVVQACPCWTAAEAGAVDGVLTDGTDAMGWPAPTSSPSACSSRLDNPYLQEANSSVTEVSYLQVVDVTTTFSSIHQCKYRKMVPGQPIVDVLLSIEFSTLTAEQLTACKDDLLARQLALDACQP